MPTAQDDEALLNKLCHEAAMEVVGLGYAATPALKAYASLVARRYAATVGVGVAEWEELRAEIKRNDSDWLFEPHESGEGYRFGEGGLYNITVTNGFLRRVLAEPAPPSA